MRLNKDEKENLLNQKKKRYIQTYSEKKTSSILVKERKKGKVILNKQELKLLKIIYLKFAKR